MNFYDKQNNEIIRFLMEQNTILQEQIRILTESSKQKDDIISELTTIISSQSVQKTDEENTFENIQTDTQMTVKQLADSGTIVITVGGGGIPVIDRGEGILQGVDAVIDKDKSSAKLAKDLEADMLVILTAVEKVYINFNKDNQQGLDFMNLKDASKYINEGHFAKGSMLPKIEACIDFVNSSTNKKALITSLEKAKDALEGKTGTLIYND